MVMTMAHSAGAVVFVSTSKLLVAKYFQGLNAGTKAQTFKRLHKVDTFACQEFGWTEEKRFEFLRCRALQKQLNISDDILRVQATDAYNDDQNIREMEAGLYKTHRVIPLSVSEETADRSHLWCTGAACTML